MSRGRGQDFRVTIVSAKNVRAADILGGKSDPYCVCEVVGRPNEKKQKTHAVSNTTDPKWNYTFEVKNCTGVEHLKFSVYDSDWDSDDPLGTATMAASLYFRPEGFDGELNLVDKEARSAAFLKVRVVPVNGGSNADSLAHPGAQSPAGSPRGPVAGAQPPARPGAYNRVEAMSRGRGQDFRITIVSAKNLRAADILGGKSDPYCVCEVVGRPDEKKQKTHSVNNTTDPKWNYTFEVKNCTGVEHLKFSVYDSDWDSDDPLGTATMASSLYFRPEGFDGELDLVDQDARSAALLKVRVVPVKGGSGAQSPAGSSQGGRRPPRPLGIEHSLNEGVELADRLEERAAKLQENFKQAQDSIVSMDRLFEEADACIKKSQTTLNRTAKRIHDLTIRASSLNLGQDAHHVQEDFGEAVHQPEIRSRRGKAGRSARAAMPQLR